MTMIMEYVVLLYCLCEGELQNVPVLLLVPSFTPSRFSNLWATKVQAPMLQFSTCDRTNFSNI